MKLNRRNFLKAVAATVAGTALARVAGTETHEVKNETSTTVYGPGAADWTTPSHELLSKAHPDIAKYYVTVFVDDHKYLVPLYGFEDRSAVYKGLLMLHGGNIDA